MGQNMDFDSGVVLDRLNELKAFHDKQAAALKLEQLKFCNSWDYDITKAAEEKAKKGKVNDDTLWQDEFFWQIGSNVIL